MVGFQLEFTVWPRIWSTCCSTNHVDQHDPSMREKNTHRNNDPGVIPKSDPTIYNHMRRTRNGGYSPGRLHRRACVLQCFGVRCSRFVLWRRRSANHSSVFRLVVCVVFFARPLAKLKLREHGMAVSTAVSYALYYKSWSGACVHGQCKIGGVSVPSHRRNDSCGCQDT